MAREIIEREVPVVTDGSGRAASSFIWALAMVIIVGLIVGALYYSGFLRKVTQPQQHKVDVTVQAPASN